MTFWIITVSMFIVFCYAGYVAWLAVLARVRPRPWRKAVAPRSATVVISAFNEAGRIVEKLENLRRQDYPASRLEIIVVSDGSSDGTDRAVTALAKRWAEEGCETGLKCISLSENHGKAVALNLALDRVTSEFVVFSDVRQLFDKSAISYLLQSFADPDVGAVSGELRFSSSEVGERGVPLGLYWRMETAIRKKQAETGSVMGVTGAIYAMRRELFRPLPEDMLVDDLYLPLQVIASGKRVVLDERALAWDQPPQRSQQEYRRKVRTLTGVWQCAPFLFRFASGGRPGAAARFFAHKLSRLLAPWALIALFLLCTFSGKFLWQLFAALQLGAYGLALAAAAIVPLQRIGILRTAHFFLLLNMAAAQSLFEALRGQHRQLWSAPPGRGRL